MKLRFEYGHIFDLEIAELSGKPLDQNIVAAMDNFVPRLTQQWQHIGVPLLEAAVNVSGLSFQQAEAKCILTVSDFVSMSHPLIVNVKKYVQSGEIGFLNEVIFHEVLHVLLTDNWQVWPTALIQKYSGEDQIVAAHLHLMSIERAVHQRLQNQDHLEAIAQWYQKIGGGYDTAWDTISRDGLFHEFIGELKDRSQWDLRD